MKTLTPAKASKNLSGLLSRAVRGEDNLRQRLGRLKGAERCLAPTGGFRGQRAKRKRAREGLVEEHHGRPSERIGGG